MQVTFGSKDLVNFNTKSKTVIKEQTGVTEQDKVLQSLFVTNAAEAVDEFEQEKQADIEETLAKKIAKPDIKQGWGQWAGSGVDESNYEAKKAKAEQARLNKIDQLKRARLDLKMKGVQVNAEERDKKFVRKYLVKELPPQF